MPSIFEKFPWKEDDELFGEANFNITERKAFENSVIFWFGYDLAREEAKAEDLTVICIFRSPNEYPDATLVRKIGEEPNTTFKVLNVEFEENSSNFKFHGHDPKKCDLIVCASHDWKEVFPNEKCPLDVYVVACALEGNKFFPKED